MLDGHGDDLFRYRNHISVNFSSNVYHDVNLQGLFAHLTSLWNKVCAYPQPEPYTAEHALAASLGIRPEEVCMTNGATEAIYLVAQTFNELVSGIMIPTFSEYADACCMHKHKLLPFDRLEDMPSKASLIWICNPNNPTGSTLPFQEIESLICTHPDTLFILDQSYEYFTAQRLFSAQEAICYPNVILLHSLTKQFAIPGLRTGYLTACRNITTKIRCKRMPWSVNQMAIEATLYLLQHQTDFGIDLQHLAIERKRIIAALQQTGLIKVHPGDTHIILGHLLRGTAADLKDYLAQQHGLLIRDASNFKGLDERYFRIALQKPIENDRLIEAIYNWTKRETPWYIG